MLVARNGLAYCPFPTVVQANTPFAAHGRVPSKEGSLLFHASTFTKGGGCRDDACVLGFVAHKRPVCPLDSQRCHPRRGVGYHERDAAPATHHVTTVNVDGQVTTTICWLLGAIAAKREILRFQASIPGFHLFGHVGRSHGVHHVERQRARQLEAMHIGSG